MSRYIPMPAYPDMMPVDISFVFEDEKPAGKHGFIHADGEDLRFEDGTLARFWGVNVNGGACFPDKDYAPKCARRLAQAGCNIIRFHQLDAEWDTPNLFSFTKGKRVITTRQLDPRSLDALDYFIHCLKEEGIYVYLDMMTYRKFKEGDDVPQHELLNDSAKPWSIINARLIELQKEFCTQIWTHVNPYTGLRYCDDPAIVLTEITNECDMFLNRAGVEKATYYAQEFQSMYKAWLEQHGIEADWENTTIHTDEEHVNRFKMELTKKYYAQMQEHMRSIGVKIPITGTNWSHKYQYHANEGLEFMDSHHYFYDWNWGNTERICKNAAITAAPFCFPNLAKLAIAGKPFFISEWDMPWPNSYRAESPIYYAAVGALQGWSGFTIHTYAYSTRLDKMDVLGKELSSPVAGVPYREGIFSTWNDPAKFGLFYHSALITRRCDVTPAKKKVAVCYDSIVKESNTAMQGLLEQHKAGVVTENKLPAGYDQLVMCDEKCPSPTPGILASDNGQLWRDLNKQIAVVDTPRTKCVYGKIGNTNRVKADTIPMDGMRVHGKTDFGVIALSSLTNEGIETSDNMLLSAIGRARNTNATFDGEKMIDVGSAPILAEVIQATVSIKTIHGKSLQVWGVNAEGFYAGKLDTTYDDGWLSFEIGDENNPACYYLIVKE